MFILDTVKETVTCGNFENLAFDSLIPDLTSTVVNIIKIGIPIILIFLGMLDLGKAVMAQKEDEIKKSQQIFVKRLISAVLVFLVVFIVQTVIGLVARGQSSNITKCIGCFLGGSSSDYCVEVNVDDNVDDN